MESAQSEIEITDSTLTWKSNLLELLPKDQTGISTTKRLFGYLDSKDEMQYATFESVGNGTYTVPAPADAWAANSFPTMYFFWDSYIEGWNVHMQATCEISNRHIEQVPYVCLSMSSDEYDIVWGHNFWGENNYIIDIYSVTADTPTTSTATSICFLVYDATSGKLTEVRK